MCRSFTAEAARIQEEVPTAGLHLRHVQPGRQRATGEPGRRADLPV